MSSKSAAMRGDLTEGPVLRTLMLFSVPMLLSNILQSLSGTVNSIWVGRLIGEDALAATANANIIMFLVAGAAFGFGMAATVKIGQRFGARYVAALHEEVGRWLAAQPDDGPIGVAFSGGVDSGAVLLSLYCALLDAGQSPSRLKAFTLAVDGGGPDLDQARRFLAATGLEMLGEAVEVSSDEIDPFAAVELIEDYKPLDVESAAMALALLGGVRRRYPEWRVFVDGDGGDENLKAYPIEENPELTIRSVVGNPMLYQEGWGVEAIKHSLTYSGGYSRSCVRSWGPARRLGFVPFSPYTRPAVVAAAEAIPFAELTGGSHQALYALKGDLVSRGVWQVLGLELPVFPKRRFQHGAGPRSSFAERFAVPPGAYRQHLHALYGGGAR